MLTLVMQRVVWILEDRQETVLGSKRKAKERFTQGLVGTKRTQEEFMTRELQDFLPSECQWSGGGRGVGKSPDLGGTVL